MTIEDALHEIAIDKINKELNLHSVSHVATSVEGVKALGEPVIVLASEVIEFQTRSRRRVFKGHSWTFLGLDGEEFEMMISTPLIIVNDFSLYDEIIMELQNDYE